MADDAMYDVNFCLPVKELENDRIKLTPFIPAFHADPYWEGSKDHPEIYDHLPMPPLPSKDAIIEMMEKRARAIPRTIVFAILDKTRASSDGDAPFAGVIGLLNTDPDNSSTELGWLIILPAFQRTHVTTNAIGLLLTWCLDSPTEGGMGFRRVQYTTHPDNIASLKKAKSMGFKFEMVQRYQRKLLKEGEGHTVVLSMCWDEWSDERPKVHALMDRKT